MSRFDYSNNPVVKRVDTVKVSTRDYSDILENNDLNRVQKVLAIRDAVRDSYSGYREVSVRFVDGVINDLVDHAKIEGRPLPDTMLFEVEMYMPLVEASNVPVSYKKPYKEDIPPTWREDNDHIYWS